MSGKKNYSGISMLEIIISMLILALVLVGLINVFVVSRSYIAHSRSRTSASQVAAIFLDPLQNEVDETDWNQSTNCLTATNGWRTGPSLPFNGVNYTSTYEVTNESAGTELRRVRINVTWNETKN